MKPELIAALLQLAISAPALETDIKGLFASQGVTPEQEQAARDILAKDPNAYFTTPAPSTGNTPSA